MQVQTLAKIAADLDPAARAAGLCSVLDLTVITLRLTFGSDNAHSDACENGIFVAAQALICHWVASPDLSPERIANRLLACESLPRVQPQRADHRRLSARSPPTTLPCDVSHSWTRRRRGRYLSPLWFRQPGLLRATVSSALRDGPERRAPSRLRLFVARGACAVAR
jgi:hypothetical protein